jgi:hypothetical protein
MKAMRTRPSTVLVFAVILSLSVPGTLVRAGRVEASQSLGAPAGVANGEPAHFSVNMQIEQEGERMVMRRYVDGPRSRMEMDVDGEQVVTIQLGDADGTTYTLMPGEERAMKFRMATMQAQVQLPNSVEPPAPQPDPGASAAQPDEGAPTLVGTETINGRAAEKYQLQMPEGSGFIWVDAATQLPLRMEAAGTRVEMSDYDFSKPAPELFEIPKEYEIVDMNEMMRSMNLSRIVAGGIVGSVGSQVGGQLAGNVGGSIGAGIGGALGGPIGAMVGRFLGERIGRSLGQKAGKAVAKPF